MKAGALATLSQVKSWLAIAADNTTTDQMLDRLIDSASAFVYSYLSLDTFAKSQYDELYDGAGGSFMVLRQDPAQEVLALAINGSPVPAVTGDGKTSAFTNGYRLFQQKLTLFGFVFPNCRSSVYVSYTAGFYISGERHTISGAPRTVSPNHTMLADGGVTLADGTPLTFVENAADLDNLLYTIDADGNYVFESDQDGATVLISYSYVPADINQAVIELVAERFKYKDRIGHSSKSLGGQETVSFQGNNVPQFIIALLNKYIRVVPA